MIRSKYFKLTPPKLSALVVTFLLLLAAGWSLWEHYHKKDLVTPTATSKTSTGASVNLNPPTEAQKNPARDNPTTQSSTTPAGTKKKVSPIITSADKQSVYAYVPGIVEDGGTCTATYSHGQDKVTASSQAFSNVSYTSCKRIALDGPLNISGTWSVVVSYSSSTSEGNSQGQTVEVK